MSYGPGPGQPPHGGSGGYFPPPPGGTGGYPPPPGGPGGYPPPPGGPGGYPPPYQSGPPEPPYSMGSAIGAIIANTLALCLCWAFALVGLVLGVVGASLANSNPSAAKTCTLISWILFAVSAVVGLIYIVMYGAWFLTALGSGAY